MARVFRKHAAFLIFCALLAGGFATAWMLTQPNPATATLTVGGTSREWVNVTKYENFQAAIDATPTGGHLYVPTGRYTTTTRPRVVPMTISRQIHIQGDGAWHDSDPDAGGAVIEWATDSGTPLIFIDGGSGLTSGTADGTVIENLFLVGSNTSSGKGRGMVARNVHHLTLRSVQFYHWSRVAFEDSLATGQYTVTAIFDRCSFQRTTTGNLVNIGTDLGAAIDCTFRECHFINNSAVSLYLANATITNIRDCTFENDVDGASATGKDGAFILWEGGNDLNIRYNYFERTTVTDPPNNWMIYLNGQRRQCVIDGNHFARTSTLVHSLRAIKLEDSGTGPQTVRIVNNLGVLAGTTSGHDDVVISNQAWVQMENNKLQDASFTDRRWWVSNFTSNGLPADFGHITRFNEHGRIRVQAFNRDSIESWSDVDQGDIAYSSTDGVLLTRSASRWRRVVPFVYAGPGPPQSGFWNIGDQAFSQANDSLFVRRTQGTGIAVTDWQGMK